MPFGGCPLGEAAPADLPPSSALLLKAGVPTVRAPSDQMEVCPLSREVMLAQAPQPLSAPLQRGLCFLHRPLPAAPSVRLAVFLPREECNGLTMFRR